MMEIFQCSISHVFLQNHYTFQEAWLTNSHLKYSSTERFRQKPKLDVSNPFCGVCSSFQCSYWVQICCNIENGFARVKKKLQTMTKPFKQVHTVLRISHGLVNNSPQTKKTLPELPQTEVVFLLFIFSPFTNKKKTQPTPNVGSKTPTNYQHRPLEGSSRVSRFQTTFFLGVFYTKNTCKNGWGISAAVNRWERI